MPVAILDEGDSLQLSNHQREGDHKGRCQKREGNPRRDQPAKEREGESYGCVAHKENYETPFNLELQERVAVRAMPLRPSMRPKETAFPRDRRATLWTDGSHTIRVAITRVQGKLRAGLRHARCGASLGL